MKTKSGNTRTIKAALMLLVMMIFTSQMGYSQLVGFNGRLPKKSIMKTNYKCKNVGVQKVKQARIKQSNKKDVPLLVLKKESEQITVSLVAPTPLLTIETKVEETPIKVSDSVVSAFKLYPKPVYFRYDSYRLDIIDLTQIALAVTLVKEGKAVTIIGHTDNWGSEQYNAVLSHKRATIIKEIMVNMGCNSELITAHGGGENYPIDTNEHHEGRQNNRRVEFIFAETIN